MIDYFKILDQPRRPWLEAAFLKESFQYLAAIQHPDAAETGDAALFALLNTAYSTLREPALRLRHLLELESEWISSTAPIPPALVEIFMELAACRNKLERFLTKQSAASTALEKALLGMEKNALRDTWGKINDRIEAATVNATARLKEIDVQWAGLEPMIRETLVVLHQEFAYLARWEVQLREGLLALEL